MRRLLLYTLGLVGFFTSLELLLRSHTALFFGASHRALFKASNYVARGGADVAFFGSSRTADGVLPVFVGPGTYNLAISSTSIEVLEWLAHHVSPPRRLAVVEVSLPQSLERRPQWLPAPPTGDPESRIAYDLASTFSLLELRHAFRFDGLARLAATLFAQRFDGSEITAHDFVTAVLGTRQLTAPTGGGDFIKRMITPSAGTSAMAERYLAVAGKLGKVVFYIPPMQSPEPLGDLPGQLAARAPVWDLSASALPADWYRDPDHLNARGAAELSRWLGEELRAVQ